MEYIASLHDGIGYEHELKFAPTKELVANYRQKRISWDKYTKEGLYSKAKIDSINLVIKYLEMLDMTLSCF